MLKTFQAYRSILEKNILHQMQGNLAKQSAKWIDNIYRQPTLPFWKISSQDIKVRSIFLLFFIPATGSDAIVNFAHVLFFMIRRMFAANHRDNQEGSAKIKKYRQRFLKNVFALLASPIGIINPQLVSFHFIPKHSKSALIVGGHLYTSLAQVKYPKKVSELLNMFKQAMKEKKKITILGAGKSQGEQFIPAHADSLVINMKHFNQIKINPEAKTATVGAGVLWSDLQLQANTHCLAIKVMQASNIFSVGGSISTNIHGWHKEGTLGQTIHAITILDPKGKMLTLKPTDELFQYVIGGFGQFGIILSATIELTNNELLAEKSVAILPDEYVNYFKNQIEKNENVPMHLYRLSIDPQNLLGEGIAVNYVKTSQPSLRSPHLHQESRHGTWFQRIALNLARHCAFVRRWYWQNERNLLLKHEPRLTTNEIMQPPINAMFNHSMSGSEWLQEFFIPGEHLAHFLKALGTCLTENKVVLLNATVRYVRQDTISKMGYAHGGDRFAVVLCFHQRLKEDEVLKAQQWIRKAIDLSLAGGTYYLPYQSIALRSQFEKAYPTAKAVYQAKKRFDPEEIFSSGFTQKYMMPSTHARGSNNSSAESVALLSERVVPKKAGKINTSHQNVLQFTTKASVPRRRSAPCSIMAASRYDLRPRNAKK